MHIEESERKEQSNTPAQKRRHVPFFVIPVPQMSVPGESHEGVGTDQQNDTAKKNRRLHRLSLTRERRVVPQTV
jgi:hypothetical protein